MNKQSHAACTSYALVWLELVLGKRSATICEKRIVSNTKICSARQQQELYFKIRWILCAQIPCQYFDMQTTSTNVQTRKSRMHRFWNKKRQEAKILSHCNLPLQDVAAEAGSVVIDADSVFGMGSRMRTRRFQKDYFPEARRTSLILRFILLDNFVRFTFFFEVFYLN